MDLICSNTVFLFWIFFCAANSGYNMAGAGSRCAQPCMALANGPGPRTSRVRPEHVVVECKGIRKPEDRT